ncbi:hypothetical protein FACS1894216_04280 [Synergistales bacterium]|nr:hypothetical protein FACS1894216_04280 [Synergistales bacterium]
MITVEREIHKISEAKRRFLADESADWVERSLISEEQREGILEGYAVTRRFPFVIVTLGLAMIGMGVLSFIAANWRYMPGWTKIALVVAAYIASVGGSYFCEKRKHGAASDSLLFMSGFFLLGGLVVSAQVFHIQGNPTDLFATWLAAFAPTFLLARNVAIYSLYEAAGFVYMNLFFVYQYDYSDRQTPLPIAHWQPILLMAVIVGMAWACWYEERHHARAGRESAPESERLIKKLFVGGSSRRICMSNFFVINWFTWFCVLNSRHESLLPYTFGILAFGVLFDILGRLISAADLDRQGLFCVSIAGLALTFPFVWEVDFHRDEFMSSPETLIAALLLGAYLLYRILRRRRGSGFATFMFCVLLARWYFDKFYEFMSKSLFFTLGGLALLAAAFGYRRWLKSGGVSPKGGGGE